MELPASTKLDEVALKQSNRRQLWREVKKNYDLYLYLVPIFIYFIIFDFVPMFGLVIAFKDYNIFLGIWDSAWVGMQNFKDMLELPAFGQWVRNTLLLNILGLIFGFPAPIILAIMLNEIRLKMFKRISQSLLYLPHFMSWIILGGMVYQILSPKHGIINDILRMIGLPEVYFMISSSWWVFVYIASGIWQGAGWGTILYLAAMTGIDPSLYEAAKIDGAGRWKQIKHITIPGIMPTVAVLLILSVGNLVKSGFEHPFALLNPIVNGIGTVIAIGIYDMGIIQGKFAITTAIGFVQSIISMALILVANFTIKKLGHEGLW